MNLEDLLEELKTPKAEPPNDPKARWHLFFILPNLVLGDKTPFATEYVSICSANDER
jgi:hypothetical protein